MSRTDRPCVIIPCAGRGSRLGLPYPKELLALAPGRTLIDEAFELLSPLLSELRVVLVISPEKTATVRYMERYADLCDLAFVFQKACYPEVIGAVLSARAWYGERNLILLPDQIVRPHAAQPDPVGAAFETLRNRPACFVCKEEHDPARLANDGALDLAVSADGGMWVRDYAEKPCTRAADYNAVWVGCGFRLECAECVLDLMDRSTRRLPVDREELERSPLYGAPAILVSDYWDLGTWESIYRYLTTSR
jgi:hypothetical protein